MTKNTKNLIYLNDLLNKIKVMDNKITSFHPERPLLRNFFVDLQNHVLDVLK